jgi:hypothetical protein
VGHCGWSSYMVLYSGFFYLIISMAHTTFKGCSKRLTQHNTYATRHFYQDLHTMGSRKNTGGG